MVILNVKNVKIKSTDPYIYMKKLATDPFACVLSQVYIQEGCLRPKELGKGRIGRAGIHGVRFTRLRLDVLVVR